VSKERDNSRGQAQQAAAKGHEQSERQVSMKGTAEVRGKHGGDAITGPQRHKTPKAPKTAAAKSPKKPTGKGRPTPKQSGPRTPAGKKRTSARVGRPDGPLARRRRARIRLLLILLLVVNVAVGFVWRDWTVSLAVLIGSVIVAPLVAALMLGRK
jgi:hypothetical protein